MPVCRLSGPSHIVRYLPFRKVPSERGETGSVSYQMWESNKFYYNLVVWMKGNESEMGFPIIYHEESWDKTSYDLTLELSFHCPHIISISSKQSSFTSLPHRHTARITDTDKGRQLAITCSNFQTHARYADWSRALLCRDTDPDSHMSSWISVRSRSCTRCSENRVFYS